MNRVDDFDQTLSAWLRNEAPAQAPDRVLDAALGRVAAENQHSGWVERLIGGTRMPRLVRAAAVTAVLAVAVLVGYELSNLNASVGPSPAPSPFVSPWTSPSASPTPLPSPSGGPIASEAASAALLLRLHALGESGELHFLTVLDDGRVVITRDEGAIRVQRVLTAAGIQLLRDELNATGLADRSASYFPVPKPGVDPPFYAGATVLEVAQPGGDMTVINWYLFGDRAGAYFKPQHEAETLTALAARLATLEEWLPAGAWAEAEARPYAPTEYRVFIYSAPWGGSLSDLSVETTSVSWPVIDGVDLYGDVVQLVARKRGDADSSIHCRVTSVVEGAAVIEALNAAGARPSGSRQIPGTALELGYRANRRQVVINLEPILPFADTSCGREITF